MEIKKLDFKKREIEVNETYVDSDGRTKERKRKILISTEELAVESQKGCEDWDGNDKNAFPHQ